MSRNFTGDLPRTESRMLYFRSRLRGVALLSALLLILVACTGESEGGASSTAGATSTTGSRSESTTTVGTGSQGSEGTLRLAYATIGEKNGHPLDLDTNQAGDIANLRYDLLVGRDPETLEPVPGLAESWEVIDDITYRFHIREGVVFHDGSTLDANDVKASLEAFISPEAVELGIEDFAFTPWLDRVEVVDDYTVDVIAKEPWRLALRSMALSSRIFPAEYAEGIDLSTPPPGSGPYVFVESVPNDSYVVEANPAYWGTPPAFERIEIRAIPEAAARIAALQAGEVDWIANVPGDSIEQLEAAGLEVGSIASIRNLWIQFNFEKEGPWQDVLVRQAMTHAIDLNAINDALYGGLAFPSIAPESQLLAFVPQDLTPYEYDPELATNLLAEAGYPDGFTDVTLGSTDGHYLQDKQLVEVIQGYFAEVGIDVALETMSLDAYFDRGTEFELGLAGWTATEGDPAAGIAPEIEFQFPWTLGGYEVLNPDIADLIAEGSAIVEDDAESERVYRELFERLWDEAVRINLFELPMIWANVPELSGFTPVPTDNFEWGNAVLG